MQLAVTDTMTTMARDLQTIRVGLSQMPLTTGQVARIIRVTPDYAERLMRLLTVAGVCDEYMGRWCAV